ncbi:MAG TPA: SDR family oxidoreductase [Aquabacterium sp.]|uniref:SDR family NAD(P)-dependent oxidoreductase n=1 Tax=Aquabacterium sp. TaxID=1872578 RepID=UPI002E2F360A|nr:SDR family oxidoreductase [Aquabacterium sp.]HEX5374323.1 SDR family oxidoreductase [Aquabacterium sp.]
MSKPLALVTGASSGIGVELARDLARRGHDLVLVARREAALRQLADELSSRCGITCHVLSQDLTAPDGVSALVAQLSTLGLSPDVLINNAGLGLIGHHVRNRWEDEQRMLDLNITALTRLTHALLPAMKQRGHGRILNVASTAAFQPGPGMAVYFASKAYVLSYSEGLHQELGRHGVTVTALCPGPTQSEFVQVASRSHRISLADRVPFASAASVARYGIEAMMRGQAVAVPGLINKLGAFSTRFTPRWMMRRIIAMAFKPV